MREKDLGGRPERPRLLSPADTAALFDLAYRTDPRRGLAKQVADALGVAEYSVERWTKDGGPPAPPDRIAEALALADQAMAKKADLLDRVAQAIKQNPGT